MSLRVQIGDQHLDVELDGVDAELTEIARPVWLLRRGRALHRVVVAPGGGRGRYVLWIDGWRVEVAASEGPPAPTPAASPSGPVRVLAPMPGRVVGVDVAVGDRVVAGERLVVIEAMKMDNAIRAPVGGEVRALDAQVGRVVAKGVFLVALEP